MRHGIILFTSDRGIRPAQAAKAAEERGFDTFYELADHGVPAGKRRAVLREYVQAMRALWTQEEAAYDGEFVNFGPCWAFPKPALRQAWAAGNRPGAPDIRVLVTARPSPGDFASWEAAGVTELLWGLPDAPAGVVEAYLDRLARRISS